MFVDLIGCGYWGANHVRELSKKQILRRVYDRDINLAKNFSERYNVEYVKNKLDLLNDKSEILFICSSVDSHFDLLVALIPHYSFIFCEKPLVNDRDHLMKIQNLVKQHNCQILTGHILLFHDSVKFLYEYFKENSLLDKIKRIRCYRQSLGKIRSFESVIESFAIHDLSVIHKFVKGDIIKTEYLLDSPLSSNNIDHADLYLTFSDNKKCLINSSWSSPIKNHKIEFQLDNQIFIFDDLEDDKNKIKVIDFEFFSDIPKIQKKYEQYLEHKISHSPLENLIDHVIEYFSGKVSNSPVDLSNFEKIFNTLDLIKHEFNEV